MTFCGNCGSDNPAENRFCFNCGAELPPAPEGPQMGYNPTMNNEVERIPAYNPNANYYNQAPPVQQQYQQQPPYGQPYQQQPFQPPAQQYQQPQYDPSYQQQPYGQSYQQQQYAAPMQQQWQPPYGQPYPQQSGRGKMVFLQGSPNNNTNLRYVGIGLSIAAFVLTIVALAAINVIDSKSLISFGLDKDGQIMILVFSIVAIVVGVASILVPMFTVVSGVCVIMTDALLKISNNLAATHTIDDGGFAIIIVLAALVMVLGIASSFVMGKYVRSNVRNVTMFQCNLFTWTGIKGSQRDQVQTPYQRPPYY